MHEREAELFEYEIDGSDRIVSVSPAWLEFARVNDAPGLTEEHVLGRPLFEFITGRETRHVYAMLLERARKTPGAISVEFRCDSPGLRRYMRLEVRARPDGSVRLTGRVLRSEPRDSISLLDISQNRSEEMLTVCSWCKRVLVGGEWLEIEGAVDCLDLFGKACLPQLTHGICEACHDRVYREIGVNAG